jgi:hypothetical protein
MAIPVHLLVLMALAVTHATPQSPPDVCAMFSDAEVAAVVGAAGSTGRQMVPGSCVWTGKGISLTIGRLDAGQPADAQGVVEVSKLRAQQGDVVKDEAGLGQRAVATVAANHRGISLIAADGPTVWNLSLDSADQAIDDAAVLPKLRDLLKKRIGPK